MIFDFDAIKATDKPQIYIPRDLIIPTLPRLLIKRYLLTCYNFTTVKKILDVVFCNPNKINDYN